MCKAAEIMQPMQGGGGDVCVALSRFLGGDEAQLNL